VSVIFKKDKQRGEKLWLREEEKLLQEKQLEEEQLEKRQLQQEEGAEKLLLLLQLEEEGEDVKFFL